MRGTWWIAPTIAIGVLSVFMLLPPLGMLTAVGNLTDICAGREEENLELIYFSDLIIDGLKQ